MKLSQLQSLAESNPGQKKVEAFLSKLETALERGCDDISMVRRHLQSSVLTDMLKQEGFPEKEAEAAKKAVEAAFKAMDDAYSEVNDLQMALDIHFKTNK